MHLYIKVPVLAVCPKCGKPILSHMVCKACGFYKGVEAVNVLKKLNKKDRKQKEKEMATKEVEEKKAL